MIISRALVEMFSHPALAEGLAFRGGTALYKRYLTPPARYSEDIDLVQAAPGPAGPMMDALHSTLDPWLGTPRRKRTEGHMAFVHRFESENAPLRRLRLKAGIDSRERFSAPGFRKVAFSVASRWFDGTADIVTYELDELLATRLRALYQRSKGRDLFDLATALDGTTANPARIATAFTAYMERESRRVTRALFERNLAGKPRDPRFKADLGRLLRHGHRWDMNEAARNVSARLVALLPGAPWKGEG